MILTQEELKTLSVEEKRELVKRQLLFGDVKVQGTSAGRKGYVTIASEDGVRQVPYTQARTAYYQPGSVRLTKDEIESGQVWGTVPIKQVEYDVRFAEKPVVRRTAEQRLDSLTARFVATWKAGRMTDELLKQIEGEYWKAGMPITAERLRAIAAQSLTKATRSRQVDTHKKVTKAAWETH